MIPVSQYSKSLQTIQRLGGKLPPGLSDLDPAVGAKECNWLGSDDPSAKWASAPLNIFLPWMKPASVPHDCWWSGSLYNDGSRESFVRSNEEFRDNLILLANDSFGWVWPGFLRRNLRANRRSEAEMAFIILMSNTCWEIFQKNAYRMS